MSIVVIAFTVGNLSVGKKKKKKQEHWFTILYFWQPWKNKQIQSYSTHFLVFYVLNYVPHYVMF